MTKVFWRCNSGHYYSVPSCPIDGWSFQGVRELVEILSEMRTHAEIPSIQELRRRGLSQDVLDRVVVVEFGGDRSVFDGICPEGYMIEGKYVPLRELSRDYL